MTSDDIHLIKSDLLTDYYEDWSKVRSPSRARRRMRYGHKQNVILRRKMVDYQIGRSLMLYSDVWMRLKNDNSYGFKD